MEYVVCDYFGCWDRPRIASLQEAVLAVTNTFEGTNFVNLSTASTVQIPEYLVNLFPKLDEADVREGTAQYANSGSSIEQVIGIMGECEWSDTRRPFSSLNLQFSNFHLSNVLPATCVYGTWIQGTSVKVKFVVKKLADRLYINRLNLLFHLENMDKMSYITCISHVPYSKYCYTDLHSSNSASPPPFNNPTFINNFSQSFLNFAMFLDTNIKSDPANTVPHWAKWDEGSVTEMVFNKTDSGRPVFDSIETSRKLLERCE